MPCASGLGDVLTVARGCCGCLQERFYFGDGVLPLFESGIPLLLERLKQLPDKDKVGTWLGCAVRSWAAAELTHPHWRGLAQAVAAAQSNRCTCPAAILSFAGLMAAAGLN
jgi:hypothetical protein